MLYLLDVIFLERFFNLCTGKNAAWEMERRAGATVAVCGFGLGIWWPFYSSRISGRLFATKHHFSSNVPYHSWGLRKEKRVE